MSAVRMGMLRLSDAAPVVMARENGNYAAHGLDVRISVEPSWANIADKLSYRQLDVAVILPPLAFAVTLGLRGVGIPLIVPMSLSLNGLAVGVSTAVAEELGTEGSPLEVGQRLSNLLSPRRPRLRFAIAHAFSTHNLLLRRYLSAAGVDPDRDVELIVVPPADTVQAVREGHVDGYCLGPPWVDVAERMEIGRTIATSSQIWRNHPEKCLAVRRDWAEANPEALKQLLAATLQAAQFCDDPANADGIATILARDNYLAAEQASIRASLPGGGPARSAFFVHAANFPWLSHAAWFLDGMARWGYLGQDIDRAALAESVYRPDLFRAATVKIGLPVPAIDSKIEGAHDAPWMLDGIAMDADLFCDGKPFDPVDRK
jgi:ABC-type nitrate/sulfonate/bicarbonate transport system substrate-binding protein